MRRVRRHARSGPSTWCACTPSRPSTAGRRLTSATSGPAAAPTLSAALSPSRSEAAAASAVSSAASSPPASAARRLRLGHVQRVLIELRAAELQGCLKGRVVCELEVSEPLRQLTGWLALQRPRVNVPDTQAVCHRAAVDWLAYLRETTCLTSI